MHNRFADISGVSSKRATTTNNTGMCTGFIFLKDKHNVVDEKTV